jgi:methionyl-tRNA formyltransferase
MNIFISGQKYFGEQILRLCINKGFKVVGVCCPVGDNYIGKLAATFEIPIIPAGLLNGDNFPDGVDLGITAHSFDYVGKRT